MKSEDVCGIEGKLGTEYLPDTNILVFNPFAIYILSGNEIPKEDLKNSYLESLARREMEYDRAPNDVYIYEVVEKELSNLAHSKDQDLAADARMAQAMIERIRQNGLQKSSQNDCVYAAMENGAKIFFVRHDEKKFMKKMPFQPDNDDRIIQFVEQLAQRQKKLRKEVILVSQDRYARSRAMDKFCKAEEFRYENIRDVNQLYTGVTQHNATGKLIDLISDDKRMFSAEELKGVFCRVIQPNQILAVLFENGDKEYRVAEFAGQDSFKLRHFYYSALLQERKRINQTIREIPKQNLSSLNLKTMIEENAKKRKPRREKGMIQQLPVLPENLPIIRVQFDESLVPEPGYEDRADQRPYFELLSDDKISVVSVNGQAGTGKTLLAILAGAVKVAQGKYERIRYLKPLIGADEGLGFYKGDFEDKIERWVKPCKDALKEIFGYNEKKLKDEKVMIDREISRLEHQGIIEYDVATHLAGSTWRNEFVVVDEAQYYTRRQIKLVLGRVGKDTKLVLLGDLGQTAFASEHTHGRVNERNSGLAHVIERLPGDPIYGHFTIPREKSVHRSEAARLASRI